MSEPMARVVLAHALGSYPVVRVVVLAAGAGVRLDHPPDEKGCVHLDVGYDLSNPIVDLRLDADALRGGFSFGGALKQCTIPWHAIGYLMCTPYDPGGFYAAFPVLVPAPKPTLSVVQ